MTTTRPPLDRFWEKVDKDEQHNGCWRWTAAHTLSGYGVFSLGTHARAVRAHRYIYEATVGPIPEGLTIDHLCRVADCVNTDHMEIVTASENSIRAHRNKPACRHGHLYSEVGFTIGFKGERCCNKCRAINATKRSIREKQERLAKTPKPWRTHCSKGHEYSEENTYWVPSTGNRACRECRKGFKSNQRKGKNG
jgi:hypothetical protein